MMVEEAKITFQELLQFVQQTPQLAVDDKDALELDSLRDELVYRVKEIRVLDHSLEDLDMKIVRHRIGLQEVVGAVRRIKKDKKSIKVDDGDDSYYEQYRRVYESLLYLLQTEPYPLVVMVMIRPKTSELYVQAVMYSIYGDQISSRALLEWEFNKESRINTVLRGNNITSKLLVAFARYDGDDLRRDVRRREGMEYITNVIKPLLLDIVNDKDLDLEVNPSKMYQKYVDEMQSATPTDGSPSVIHDRGLVEADVLNQYPDIGRRCEQNMAKLRHKCDLVLSRIFDSMMQIPYGIRWISSQIDKTTRTKLIGGFLFLRYITPLIAAPFAHRLIDVKPSNQANRNLVLLAKAMQNVSNLVAFGRKETYMMPLNSLMEDMAERRSKFFKDLIQVAPPEQYLSFSNIHQCVLSRPQMITTTVRELGCIHELLRQKYVDKVQPNSVQSKQTPDDDDGLVEMGEYEAIPVDSYSKQASDSVIHLTEILNELGPVPVEMKDSEDLDVSLLCSDRWAKEHAQDHFKQVVLVKVVDSLTDVLIRWTPSGDHVPPPNSPSTRCNFKPETLMDFLEANCTVGDIPVVRSNLDELFSMKLFNKTQAEYADIVDSIFRNMEQRLSRRHSNSGLKSNLQLHLKTLAKQRIELQEQLKVYVEYVDNCMRNQVINASEFAPAEPITYQWKRLVKRKQIGILDSEDFDVQDDDIEENDVLDIFVDDATMMKKATVKIALNTPGIMSLEIKNRKINVNVEELLILEAESEEMLEDPPLLIQVKFLHDVYNVLATKSRKK